MVQKKRKASFKFLSNFNASQHSTNQYHSSHSCASLPRTTSSQSYAWLLQTQLPKMTLATLQFL